MFFADGDDVAARIEEAVAAALIHQRVGPETRRHFSATRLAYQRDMIDVGRAVRPLIGTRQRRMAACRIEGLRFGIEAAEVHGVADFCESGSDFRPAIERILQCVRDLRSEEHTSELQSLMRISYAVFCLKKK